MSGAYFRLLADRGELPALDGLRGIAILLVVVYHCVDSFAHTAGGLFPIGGIDLAVPGREDLAPGAFLQHHLDVGG